MRRLTMVKNHRHGAIGHNKHGAGDPLPTSVAETPSTSDVSLEHDSSKRQRTSTASISTGYTANVSKEMLHALVADEFVTISGAQTVDDIQAGVDFSLTVEDPGSSELHDAIIKLLNDKSAALTALDLTENEMSPEHSLALAQAVGAPACRLRSLSLRFLGMGPDCGQALATALASSASTLRHLNLERNGLGQSGGSAVGRALGTPTLQLTCLDLSLNYIGPDGGEAVATALLTNTSLTELTMLRCGIGPAAVSYTHLTLPTICSV